MEPSMFMIANILRVVRDTRVIIACKEMTRAYQWANQLFIDFGLKSVKNTVGFVTQTILENDNVLFAFADINFNWHGTRADIIVTDIDPEKYYENVYPAISSRYKSDAQLKKFVWNPEKGIKFLE